MTRSLTLIAFLCATGKAFATLFTGSFTVTLTDVQFMPEYQVGDSFINTFHYDADDRDGTFYYDNGAALPPGANKSLDGQIFWAFPSSYDYKVLYTGSETFNGYHSFLSSNGGYVTVEGGTVTDFQWVTDFGSFTVYITETGYATSILNTYYEDENGNFLSWAPSPSTFGTPSFWRIQSDQAPAQSKVPDDASTLALLCATFVTGWASLRSRRNLQTCRVLG